MREKVKAGTMEHRSYKNETGGGSRDHGVKRLGCSKNERGGESRDHGAQRLVSITFVLGRDT